MKVRWSVLAAAAIAALGLGAAQPQVRYVSCEGDDANDGLTERTAWRTLRKLGESLPSGGMGLLRRGDVFYGQMKIPAGRSPDLPTTVDAYGTGPLPEVCGYKIPKRDESVWKPVGDKLWQIDLSDHSLFDGNHETDDGNVGFLLVDGRFFGQKSSFKKKQTPSAQWGFVDDYRRLTVWSEGNPAAVAKDIRIAVKGHLLVPESNAEIRNVVFRGTGSHGLNAMDPSHVRISGCSFLEIGGSYLEPKPEWGGTRYGNGVQLWRGGSDIVVTNCTFAEIYDVAFTMQGPKPVRSWEDVHVVDCVITNCTQCFEVWAKECSPGVGFRNCSFRRNRCLDTGFGWGYDVRPNRVCASPILMYRMDTDVCEIQIEDNYFENSRGTLVYKNPGGILLLPETFVVRGNTVVGPTDRRLANRMWGKKTEAENAREAEIRKANTFVQPSGFMSLWTAFTTPPESARPWCYWWWVNGHADRETVTADLEAMKRLGFGGVLMFDSRGYWDDEDHVVNPKAETAWGSAEWYDVVEFAVRECARLGLEFTMNASASGGTLNGFKDGKEYEVDVINRDEVAAHLDRAVGPLLRRVPELVGKTFTHIYSVSYEGSVKTGGSWSAIKDNFYATMRDWAHSHGLKVYSESGGPWFGGAKSAKLDCDQLDLLAHNDFPQGEFWPLTEKAANARHANANGRFFLRGIVLSARREGRRIASMEAFTHMHRHYYVDPSVLKPLADIAFADGANRLVWHTFTCSPEKFGVPGAEYFAGSHINRNVTWHDDAAAFVGYLGRCQALLQRGDYVDDGEFLNVTTNYYTWGRFRKDEKAQFTTIHRREGDLDWFFVAGEGKGDVVLNAKCEGRKVELWDAVTATRKGATAQALADGKTRVSLDLPVGGSAFVVFAPEGSQTGLTGFTRLGDGNNPVKPVNPVQNTCPITNAWRVSFAYHKGVPAEPPAPVTMETLRDWTSYGEEGKAESTSLRYFSGTATYRTTFSFSSNQTIKQSNNQTITLSLGEVPTGLAHVFVNGKDCGTVWCAPWEADVSSAVREGENEIEIRYVNNWFNRLVGDCFLKPEERVTRSTLHYWNVPRVKNDPKRPWRPKPTYCSGPSVSDQLQPSGLLGPVSLVSAPRSK